MDPKRLDTNDWIFGGAAAVLFLLLFFGWKKVCFGAICATGQSGFSGFGVLMNVG